MDALKRILMVIGGGAVLGLALAGLASLDSMSIGAWIIVGLLLVIGAWMSWGTASLIRARGEHAKEVEPRIITHYVVPPSDLEHLQSRLRGYAVASFAALSLVLTGWSQLEEKASDIPWFPDSAVITLPVLLLQVLAITSTLLTVASLAGSISPRMAQRIREYERWIVSVEVMAGVGILAALATGWYAGIPAILDLPVGYVYAYAYGGSVFLVAATALYIMYWFGRPIRAAAARVNRRIRRAPLPT